MGATQVASDSAALMVTHDGAPYLRQQFDSIMGQSVLPAVLVVVDDASRDATRVMVRELARTASIPVELILTDSSNAPDAASRVARNVVTGLAACAAFDVTILSDQDDEWLVDRVERQRAGLAGTAGALLIAGDGVLVGDDGRPVGGRIRDRFAIPDGWDMLSPAERTRAALRRPLVTGAAAAITVELARLLSPVPRGWFHDRWATLLAVARNGLVLQPEPVIRYRLHGGQLLGLDQAGIGSDRRRWQQVLARGTGPVQAASRTADIVRRVRPMATDPAIRSELSWSSVLRSAFDRA